MIRTLEDLGNNIGKYLPQFDLHVHTFAHCVQEQDGETKRHVKWDGQVPSLDEKMDIIANRMRGAMQQAVSRGVKVLAFTEHPQYTIYSVEYARYSRVFEALKKQFSSRLDRILWGLELDLEIAKDKRAFIDELVIGNEQVGHKDTMLNDAELVIGSLHLYTDWRRVHVPSSIRKRIAYYGNVTEYIKGQDDYLSLTLSGLDSLGELRKRLNANPDKRKVFVYGHPWGAAWMINKRQFELDENQGQMIPIKDEDPRYQRFLAYHRSSRARIPSFSPSQWREVSHKLIEHGIYPEINWKYIGRGAIEYDPARIGPTLLQAYVAECSSRKVRPLISVCSDAHSPLEVGDFDWRRAAQGHLALHMARVWAEDLG